MNCPASGIRGTVYPVVYGEYFGALYQKCWMLTYSAVNIYFKHWRYNLTTFSELVMFCIIKNHLFAALGFVYIHLKGWVCLYKELK